MTTKRYLWALLCGCLLLSAPFAAFAADEPKPVLGVNDFEGKDPLKNVIATNAELSLTKSDVLAGTQSLEITFKPGQEVAEIVFPLKTLSDYDARVYEYRWIPSGQEEEAAFTSNPANSGFTPSAVNSSSGGKWYQRQKRAVTWLDYDMLTLYGKVKGTAPVRLRLGIEDNSGAEYLPEIEFTPNARNIEIPTMWMLKGFSPRGWCNDRVDISALVRIRLAAPNVEQPFTLVIDDLEFVQRMPLAPMQDLRSISGNGYVVLTWTGVPGSEYYLVNKSTTIAQQLQSSRLLGSTPLTYLFDPAVENGAEYSYLAMPVDEFGRPAAGVSNPAGAVPTASRPASPLLADRFGGFGAREYDVKGHFYLNQVEGKWTLVDPIGGIWFGIGLDGAGFDNTFTPLTADTSAFPELDAVDVRVKYAEAFRTIAGEDCYSPYLYNVITKYGDANGANWKSGWAENTLDRIRSMNFNLLGRGTDPSIVGQKLVPYLARFELPEGAPVLAPGIYDPFAPGFEAAVKAAVAARIDELAKDALLVGYDLGDLAPAHLQGRGDTFLADTVLKLPAGAPAKQALFDLLNSKYGNASALGTAWGVQVSAIGEEASSALLGADNARARLDKGEFAAALATRYLTPFVAAIRATDTRHLLVGPRLALGASDALVKAVAAQVDLLQINCDMLEFPWERFGELYAAGQKPMIVTGFALASSDSGLPNVKGASCQVVNQEERALVYQQFLNKGLQQPYIVGIAWDGYIDYPKTADVQGRDAGVGITDVKDTMQPFAARTLQVANFNAFLVGAPTGFFKLEVH